jgi:hypothetical protein
MSDNELQHAGVKGMKWGVRRYQNADGTLTPEGKKRYGAHADYKQAHSRKSVKKMSNEELKARNNRLQMEVNYRDLKKKSDTGKRAVKAFIATAGTITAATAAFTTYKKLGTNALDKVGGYVVKGVDLSGKLTD